MKKIFACFAIILFFSANSCSAADDSSSPTEPSKLKLEKVERSFGAGYFRMHGYKDFIEPRISFIKRKSDRSSEVIEYAWRPMQLADFPHKERIDRIRFSFNRYFYSGKDLRLFFGTGVGGNVILFNDKLKEYGRTNNLNLRDGVNGLGRVFVGYKVSEVEFNKVKYPVVLRVDSFFSPAYKFGGNLGKAGDKLKLSEVIGGVSFSVE